MANPFELLDKGQSPFEVLDQQAKQKSIPKGMTDTAARFMTLGLAPHAGAAGEATGRLLAEALGFDDKATGGKGWLDLYRTALQKQRERDDAFSTEHPYLNAAAGAAGAISTGAPKLLASAAAPALPAVTSGSMGSQIGRGAAIGAPIGGIAGAAESREDNPLGIAKDAAKGLVAGGALGAALPPVLYAGAPAASALARKLIPGSVDRQAANLLANRAVQDFGPGEEGVNRLLSGLPAPGGAPMTIMDAEGANLLALGGKLSRAGGESRQTMTKFLQDRHAGQTGRLTGYLDDVYPENAFYLADDISQQQFANAQPLYTTARAAPPVNPDTLEAGGTLAELIQRPSMKAAGQRALKILDEKQIDPASLGIAFDADGNVAFTQVPSWDTLHLIRRGLDAELKSHRNPLTGKLDTEDDFIKALNKTRGELKEFIHKENPDWAAADASWAEPEAITKQLQVGAKFRTMRPEAIEKHIGNLNPAEADAFRIGATDLIRQEVNRTGSPTPIIGGDAANRRGAGHYQDQLAAIFGTQKAETLGAKAASEQRAAGTMYDIIGGSPTGRRVAEDVPKDGGFLTGGGMQDAATAVMLAPSHPWAAAGLGMRTLHKMSPRETTNQEVYDAAARIATNPDIQGIINALTAPQTTGLQLLAPPAANAAGGTPAKYSLRPTIPWVGDDVNALLR